LLLADEQESMVDHYLEKGNMYVLEDGNVKAECVVTDEGNGILEIKNIAVDVAFMYVSIEVINFINKSGRTHNKVV
jgi:hypothetical protein